MESKVTILTPNGRRQNIKVTPNTTLMQMLEEACRKHDFITDDYCLKHHNKEVSLSQTFRFSGLPNNCLLEMHPTDKKRIVVPVDICVQTEDGTRKQSQFKPDDNLWHVLEQLQGTEDLQKYDSPVVLYMRQEILGKEQLSNTTLKSLGIMAGRALLRLLNKKPEELKTQAMVYKAPVPKIVSPETEANRPKISKSAVPGGSGFAITKDLVQSLKESSAKETEGTHKTNDEDSTEGNDTKGVDTTEAEQPKYDWGSAPGRSMRSSVTQSEVEGNNNIEAVEVGPEYHILGDRNALIFSLPSSSSQIAQEPDSFYDATVDDLKIILRDLRKSSAGNENAPLLTEKSRKLQENETMLRKIAQYKYCIIRIQFPDRHVLQGTFEPTNKISDVKEFTRSYLHNPNKPFYLYTKMPLKTKLDESKTLLELNCVPTALLHLSFDDETDDTDSFIKKEFLDKLTSPQGASYLASILREQDLQDNETNQTENETSSTSTGAIPKRPRN